MSAKDTQPRRAHQLQKTKKVIQLDTLVACVLLSGHTVAVVTEDNNSEAVYKPEDIHSVQLEN